MDESCETTLAGGLWREDRRLRSVRLVAPQASARWELLREQREATPAQRVTALLAASIAAIDGLGAPTADDVRDLTIGDRDRLVLALRSRLSGDELPCVFPCPCGETLELELSVSALLCVAGDDPAARERSATAPSGAIVRVRAATGADHERAADRAAVDAAAAACELVERCVIEARAQDGAACAVDGELRELAMTLLAELDPGAEIELSGTCPECGDAVSALLDPGAYVWSELERWRAQTELEVHVLASAYHWSEAEIVALDPDRRARYIELVDGRAGVA